MWNENHVWKAPTSSKNWECRVHNNSQIMCLKNHEYLRIAIIFIFDFLLFSFLSKSWRDGFTEKLDSLSWLAFPCPVQSDSQ